MRRMASALSAILCIAGCSGSPAQQPDLLPGRSRPLLHHDWKHPRDFTFAPVAFTPSDPAASLAKTASGVRAFILESAADRTVRISAALPIGRLYEQAGERGAAGLLLRAIGGDGSDSAAARERTERLDALGARLVVDESLDLTLVSIEVLPDMWRDGLRLIVDTVRNPLLDDEAIARFRAGPGFAAVTAGIGGDTFRPAIELARLLGDSPVAPAAAGTRVTREAVRGLAARALRPDTVVFGVGGHVVRADVHRALDEATRDWRAAGEPARAASVVAPPPPADRFQIIDSPETSEWVPAQGWVAIGRVIGPVADADQPALAVLAEVLDNRLNIATREVRGLSNRTGFSLPDTAARQGLMHIRSGGRQEAVAPLVKTSLDEARRLHAGVDPITDDEMRRAKGTLVLGAWQRSLDGAGQAAATFASETVRRGGTTSLLRWPGLVEAVTVDQVKQAARTYLDPAAMCTVVVGPIAGIRQARHPRWPATLEELGFKMPTGDRRRTE